MTASPSAMQSRSTTERGGDEYLSALDNRLLTTCWMSRESTSARGRSDGTSTVTFLCAMSICSSAASWHMAARSACSRRSVSAPALMAESPDPRPALPCAVMLR